MPTATGPRKAAETAETAETIKDVKPEFDPDQTGQGEVLSVKPVPSLADELRGFIAHRRTEIYRPRLGGNIGGAPAIRAQQAESVLAELENMAVWLEEGRPKPGTVLTETDKDFYRAAQARGLEVPQEILRQL